MNRKEYLKEYNKIYRAKNKEKLSEYHKIYRESYIRPSRKKDAVKRQRKKCISCSKEWAREYYQKNKKRIREYTNKWTRDKIANDPDFRFKTYIRRNIRKCLKNKVGQTTQDILGCTYLEFKRYLESKFEEWMTWENHGKYNGKENFGWDLDHVIPISSATNYKEMIKLNHYTNLQPLCSYKNRVVKRDKINE